MRSKSVLFLTKSGDSNCEQARRFVECNFSNVVVCQGDWGDAIPEAMQWWQGDYIFSYLCRWVVPVQILQNAREMALNFHPAPPEYPGVGCLNFALYEESPVYGVTCHHMAETVDSGTIVSVRRFPVFATDGVDSLLKKTHAHLQVLFYDIMDCILEEKPLPCSMEHWSKKLHSRKELDALAMVTPMMSEEEIHRRIRATAFGQWHPSVSLHGHKFVLET